MTPNIPCIDVCLMPPALVYVISHYMSIVNHSRIYFGFSPLKYHKIGVSSPGFGPKRDLNILKDAIHRCVFNENGCGRPPDL